MPPNKLFTAQIEPELSRWINGFASLEEMFAARSQLHQELTEQVMEGTLEEGATLVGPVHVGRNSRIRAGAVVHGPVIIGPNVTVGYNSVLIGSLYVGARATIGAGCVAKDSIILNDTSIEAHATAENAVVGSRVFIGGGTILGGIDIDSLYGSHKSSSNEQAVYIGDGTVIGSGAQLLRGSCVGQECKIKNGAVVQGVHGSNVTLGE